MPRHDRHRLVVDSGHNGQHNVRWCRRPCPCDGLSRCRCMGASPWIVSDELGAGERTDPLLPKRERRLRYPGRRPLPYVPRKLGFGSGVTCWRRPRDWNEAGVWQRLHEVLPAELNSARKFGWSRRVVDSSHVRAPKMGIATGPSPVDRGRAGSKHHLITDGHGTPLAVILTGGSRGRHHPAPAPAGRRPTGRGRCGRPSRRAVTLYADRGYDHDKYRRPLRQRGIRSAIAERGRPHGTGLGALAESSSGPSPGSTASATYACARSGGRHPRGLPRPCHLPHHTPPRGHRQGR
ncbi:transposase [Streptomyces sp. MC1]|uniref:transposase n=1 Tax=Streptomyces sp. MC1 TaxID=295105 RepID=UPI0035A95553